jgi:cytochrome P450
MPLAQDRKLRWNGRVVSVPDLATDFGVVLGLPASQQDPYPVYKAMRETDPVHWSADWRVWVLSRYDDILKVFRDSTTFSNAARFSRFLDGLPSAVANDVKPLREYYSGGLIQSDPPDHTRLRSLVRLAFTPRAIEGYRGRIQAIVNGLLDGRAGSDIELVRDFAYKVPVLVVCDILGVPTSDGNRIYDWNERMMGLVSTGSVGDDPARRASQAVEELESYFGDLVDDRRRHLGDDLTSSLISIHEQGDHLSRSELITTCILLLLAGHETTKNLITNAVVALLRHPDQAAVLRQNGGVLASAIEECLRFESPIQRGWRRVAVDTDILSRPMKEGDLVYLLLGAANRDPEHFPDPDEFNVARRENRHLAFGYGIHFCVGAPLARLEASIAIESIMTRFSRLSIIDNEVIWGKSLHVRCPTQLPVRLLA